jgi:hypothetical protein
MVLVVETYCLCILRTRTELLSRKRIGIVLTPLPLHRQCTVVSSTLHNISVGPRCVVHYSQACCCGAREA